MLYDLIKTHRIAILAKSASLTPVLQDDVKPQVEANARAAVFLDQLVEVLRVEYQEAESTGKLVDSESRPAPAVRMSESAALHGEELRDFNFSIEDVVRNYGNLCQAITSLAMELHVEIDAAEFRTLNWCLDEGIAQAVVAFTTPPPPDADQVNARRLAHDARLDGMAMMAYHVERIATALAAMRSGRVGLDGATGAVLDGSLKHLRALVAEGAAQRF